MAWVFMATSRVPWNAPHTNSAPNSATGVLNTSRYNHTATTLDNGRVLVAGGNNSARLATAELYDPATGTWTKTGDMGAARLRPHLP